MSGNVTAASTAPPLTWQLQAGAGTGEVSIATLAFYYYDLSVDVGDAVTWTPVGHAHTVALLPGAAAPTSVGPGRDDTAGGNTYDGTGIVASGLIVPATPGAPAGGPPSSYTLTFTAPGTYRYQCLILLSMTGTLQPAGTPYPYTQQQYDAKATRDAVTDLASGAALVNSCQVTTNPTAGGKTNYNLSAGIGNGHASSLRFLSNTVVIKAGDSVTWRQEDVGEAHTVAFAGADGKVLDFPSVQAVAPAGGATYDGRTLTNSGVLAGPPGTPGNQPYTLTFPKPRIYTYRCLIHDDLGIIGTVIVQEPARLPWRL
jgi:plastocyanin